ncbi:RagB/SusD family nutrient uptake outer membrane protein, partial [Bacteroidota bacterium]
LWTLQWELNVLGGGSNLMRREIGGKYERWSYDSDEGGRSRLANTEVRGGKGLGYLLPTSFALKLYISSSEGDKQDQRASEHALRRYFILSEGDVISDKLNVYLGRPWQVGDTIWCSPLGGGPAGDPITSGGYNFYMLSDGRNKNDWPYSLKWTQADAGLPIAKPQHNDQIYMRLAETILLKAEALHLLQRNDEAAVEINRLRDRAHAKNVLADEITLDFILDERSRELLMEEHRRYTLLRQGGMVFYNRTDQNNYFYGLCENLTPRDSLLAIPQVVIDANLTVPMKQNPGF